MLSKEEQEKFLEVLREVRNQDSSRLLEMKQYMQHGKTTVYKHCLNVAYGSYKVAKRLEKWGIQLDKKALLRGALLHDYFLYDWHEKSPERKLHGFYHPARALQNASKDFTLTEKEKDIIKNHMFPLT